MASKLRINDTNMENIRNAILKGSHLESRDLLFSVLASSEKHNDDKDETDHLYHTLNKTP